MWLRAFGCKGLGSQGCFAAVDEIVLAALRLVGSVIVVFLSKGLGV